MLSLLFNQLIPHSIKEDTLAYSHAKNIIGGGIITLVASPLYALVYYILGFPLGSCVITGLGFFIILSVISLRFTESVCLTRILIIGSLALSITWLSYHVGGIGSPVAFWLVLPPLLAIFFGGTRAGFIWAVYCVSAAVWMYLLAYNNTPLPVSPITDLVFLQTFSISGLLLIIVSLAYLFERGKQEYTAEIEATNKKLYAAKVEAEESAQRALEANHAKSAFLATMSHEIRTPLNGVLGMISMLLDTPLSHEQYEQAEVIRVSGEALLAIINNILDFSKIESERLELEDSDFDVYAMVNNTIDIIAAQVRSKDLTIVATIEQIIPHWLKGDRNRIGQVLNNLLMNAAKFTEAGEIRANVQLLSHKNNDVTLLFEIIDTGIGITPAIRERLFKPFTQGDASISRKYGGTGLGLVISKRLVEIMGGKIGVKNLPDHGSNFWFTIPLTTGEPSVIITQHKVTGLSPLDKQNIRILLVEDNMINLQVVSRILKNLGYFADAYNNGIDALNAFKNKHYDLILLDCQMPGMDGYAVTREIRTLQQHKKLHTPIVALTAHAVLGDREKCLAAGMDDYLTKPIDTKILSVTLSKWLS
jgi:signal transduction histidine kinase/CheY-like chemotaxis protein